MTLQHLKKQITFVQSKNRVINPVELTRDLCIFVLFVFTYTFGLENNYGAIRTRLSDSISLILIWSRAIVQWPFNWRISLISWTRSWLNGLMRLIRTRYESVGSNLDFRNFFFFDIFRRTYRPMVRVRLLLFIYSGISFTSV